MTYMNDTTCIQTTAPRARRLSIRRWIALWRSRRALAGLDASQLCDIGLSARQADEESRRPLWDVPHTWRR